MDKHELQSGALHDTRSDDKKALDYKHEDLAMGEIVLNWQDIEKKPKKNLPISNQDGSMSCVAQAVAKLLAMHEIREGRTYVKLCPKFVYDFRINYPDGGMMLPDALSIGCKLGACRESLLPCDMKGETFMNDKTMITPEMINDAINYKGLYYFEIASRSIDEIAKVNEQGYGVLLGFRFDRDEWTDVPWVKEGSTREVGHGIAEVDYGLYKGEKALDMDDSWGVLYGKGGRRIITETFLNARCFYAGYITSLPNYKFTKILRWGDKGIDVRKLQEKLGIKIDGIFGTQTENAVKNFQKLHGLVADGICGKLTNGELNK